MPTYLGGVEHVPHARAVCVVVMLTYFDYHVILPVVPHKPVAEVSEIGNL